VNHQHDNRQSDTGISIGSPVEMQRVTDDADCEGRRAKNGHVRAEMAREQRAENAAHRRSGESFRGDLQSCTQC
jgi:hypothetical protein